ncbi:MAG: SMP-30/gluconolactonase/LRE family protein [Alphaproteobacteria bacterium]|nr:SMP-30/gluconolactonase/LRE family protein [Alphaproteobacteria bacterium]
MSIATAILGTAWDGAGADMAGNEVINPRTFYPEGPLWRDGRLFYTEMTQDRVMVWDGRVNAVFWQLAGCGPTALAPAAGETLLVLCHLGRKLALVSEDGQTVSMIERDADGWGVRYPNDAVADGRGGVYISSSGPFDPALPASGAIMYLAPSGELRQVAGGLHYANGVTISADGPALYVSEHLARRVTRFRIEADGELADREIFLDLNAVTPRAPGTDALAGPDGLEFGPGGALWIAEYGAGRVLAVDRDTRRLLVTLSFPERFTTNLTFEPGQRVLYVTATRSTRRRPYVGRLYRRQLSEPGNTGDSADR